MKKLFLLIMIMLLVGCNSAKEKNIEEVKTIIPEEVEEEPIDTYFDENNTPIGLYVQEGNILNLVHEYKTNIVDGTDIEVFGIYPSNDESIKLNNRYGIDFYNKWISIPNYDKLKIGFSIKFTIDTGEQIAYNILDPETAIQPGKEFILAYLYDDYANRNSNWYSHIEQYQYNDESLFTALKLYANYAETGIVSKITLTIFTYDGLDDFDENNEYRGNSSYTITICDIEKTC